MHSVAFDVAISDMPVENRTHFMYNRRQRKKEPFKKERRPIRMTENSNILKAEDYIEPRCVLCDEPYGAEPAAKSVPQRRIIEKMDEYMSRRDYAGA